MDATVNNEFSNLVFQLAFGLLVVLGAIAQDFQLCAISLIGVYLTLRDNERLNHESTDIKKTIR